MQGIYYWENKVNGKIYVGKTKDIKHRYKFNKPLSKQVSNEHFSSSIKKYGEENFEFNILDILPDDVPYKHLDDFEKFYIWLNESYDPSKGYNKTLGGEGGIPTEETRKKISEAVKNPTEETRKKRSESKKNMSEETRKKMSESQKRRIASEACKKTHRDLKGLSSF